MKEFTVFYKKNKKEVLICFIALIVIFFCFFLSSKNIYEILDRKAHECYEQSGIIYQEEAKYKKIEHYSEIILVFFMDLLNLDYEDPFDGEFIADLKYDQLHYEEYAKKVLDIYRLIIGVDEPYTISYYNNLGVFYYDKKEYKESVKLYNKALDVYDVELVNKSKLADIYNNLGVLYKEKKEYEKAKNYYKKALDIYENEEHIKKNLHIKLIKNNLKKLNMELER